MNLSRVVTTAVTGALLAVGVAAPASAAPESRLPLCAYERTTNTARTQVTLVTGDCRPARQARARIEFRPDGGSVGMTIINNGIWVGSDMTSVATRTIANHHFVRALSEVR